MRCDERIILEPKRFYLDSIKAICDTSVCMLTSKYLYFFPRHNMDALGLNTPCRIHGNPGSMDEELSCHKARPCDGGYCSEVYRAFEGVKFIAESTRREQDTTRVSLT